MLLRARTYLFYLAIFLSACSRPVIEETYTWYNPEPGVPLSEAIASAERNLESEEPKRQTWGLNSLALVRLRMSDESFQVLLERHRDHIYRLLHHSNPEIRRKGAHGVGELGSSAQSFDEELGLLLGDSDPTVREASLGAIRKISALDKEEYLDRIIPLLQDMDESVVYTAIRSLMREAELSSAVVRELTALLQHESYWVRARASYYLASITSAEVYIATLLDLIHHESAEVSAFGLAELYLIAMAYSDDPVLRGGVDKSIMRRSLPALEDVLERESLCDNSRARAVYLVALLNDEEIECPHIIIDGLHDPDEATLYDTLYLLGEKGQASPILIPEYISLLQHESHRIRAQASYLLARFSPPEVHVPAWIDLLRHDDPRIRDLGMSRLHRVLHISGGNATRRGTIEEEIVLKSLPAFVDILEGKESTGFSRGHAAYVVTFLSDQSPYYAPKIAKLLDDPDIDARTAALKCLLQISNLPAECGPPLLRVLRSDDKIYSYRSSPPYSEVVPVVISNLGKNAEPILPALKRARYRINPSVRARAKLALELLEPRLEEDAIAYSAETVSSTSP